MEDDWMDKQKQKQQHWESGRVFRCLVCFVIYDKIQYENLSAWYKNSTARSSVGGILSLFLRLRLILTSFTELLVAYLCAIWMPSSVLWLERRMTSEKSSSAMKKIRAHMLCVFCTTMRDGRAHFQTSSYSHMQFASCDSWIMWDKSELPTCENRLTFLKLFHPEISFLCEIVCCTQKRAPCEQGTKWKQEEPVDSI